MRLNLVTALSRFREQCMFTWSPWILKCLEATHNWYHISLIWQVFSPGEEIVDWFDLRWCQNSTTTAEHEAEWSCYNLPIFLACRDLHHPYPRAFCTLPSFARIKRPRWRPVRLNDRHLRSNGKIGDCEQSNGRHTDIFKTVSLICAAAENICMHSIWIWGSGGFSNGVWSSFSGWQIEIIWNPYIGCIKSSIEGHSKGPNREINGAENSFQYFQDLEFDGLL